MKVVFDTNIVLDSALERKDYKSAQSLIMSVASGAIEGVVTGNSITDIFYISKKLVGEDTARRFISDVLAIFEIAPVDGYVCGAALSLPMKDFEDAVLAVCATNEDADFIVTRDADFIMDEGCSVPVISPADLLEIIRNEEITDDEQGNH
jgi:predicted nucleic acid-binding protein